MWRWRLQFSPNDPRYLVCRECATPYALSAAAPPRADAPAAAAYQRFGVGRKFLFLLVVVCVNVPMWMWACVEFNMLWRHRSHSLLHVPPLPLAMLSLNCVNCGVVPVVPFVDSREPSKNKFLCHAVVGMLGIIAGWSTFWTGFPVVTYILAGAGFIYLVPYLIGSLVSEPLHRRVLPM